MNFKNRDQNLSVFQIFKRSEDPAYPERLVKFLMSPDSLQFQLEKAEYLLNIWGQQYSKMAQIGKSTYYNIIPKLLKLLLEVYVNKGKGLDVIPILYFYHYKKWPQMNKHIKKGLKQSNNETLVLFWAICFQMIKHIEEMQKQQFGQYLADQFQEALASYQWKRHSEKVYILQIIKYINNDKQYQPFIRNGEKWSSIIKAMKQEPFKSQIKKQKGELHLQVYKYEYEQIKLGKQKQIQMQKAINKASKRIRRASSMNEDSLKDKTKAKQQEKQYLQREQINMFLVVKDQLQQQDIYRFELLNEIISCRPLMTIICEEYWSSITYGIITEIEQKIQNLNIYVKKDLLLSKTLLALLKYKKTNQIIREKIGQDIVVRIIKNIEENQNNSPFETPQFTQVPTLVNEAFFFITEEMAHQKITVQTIINKRIKSIIDQANIGKDDIVNRALMTVSCRQELTLKRPILKQIKQFLISIKKKKGVKIESCIILVKILIKSFKSPQFSTLKVLQLAMTLTQISQNFHGNPKTNQLRKQCIQLLLLLIPSIAADQQILQGQYGELIQSTLRWLEVVQLNFQIVYAPMIKILILYIDRYRDYLLAQEMTIDALETILSGLMEKMGHQHNSQNMFCFLNCLLKAYIKLQWGNSMVIYNQLPESSFIDWEIIFRKQARILFKKEQQEKWKAKASQQKAKKQREAKWNSMIRRRQDSQSSKGGLDRKDSMSQDQSTMNMSTKNPHVDLVQQKKCQQKMNVYFGKIQKEWLKGLINDHQLWNNEAIIKSQLGCLQYSLIQTITMVQKDYYVKAERPNQFFKQILADLDEDLYQLIAYLMDAESYQLLFLFSSSLFFVCRDYFFIKKLKSYQLVLTKCFQILSVFFNKVQILYACSTFCSLLLPYANHHDLPQVYHQLNTQQFLTDLFKGANQFIGKQKCYYSWLIKILMAYEITEQFRRKLPLVRQSLQTLGKNVVWWSNVEYMINGEIDVDDNQVEESKILLFDIFKDQYTKAMNVYFSWLQKVIEVGVKHRQIMNKTK